MGLLFSVTSSEVRLIKTSFFFTLSMKASKLSTEILFLRHILNKLKYGDFFFHMSLSFTADLVKLQSTFAVKCLLDGFISWATCRNLGKSFTRAKISYGHLREHCRVKTTLGLFLDWKGTYVREQNVFAAKRRLMWLRYLHPVADIFL